MILPLKWKNDISASGDLRAGGNPESQWWRQTGKNWMGWIGRVTVVAVCLSIAFGSAEGLVAQGSPVEGHLGALASQSERIAPAELPKSVADAVREAAARDRGESREEWQIVDARQKTWPDGCLGLADPEVFCTQALVRGWEVVVGDRKQQKIYRTDEDGSVVKRDRNFEQADEQ
ncbi:hypothetical protein [Phormidium sp. CCY1219]|uniref:hypothetical protein n=1 Tax=Phormidium sp. CCY1219 TaxID=2886104 RepID=UPI002D1E5110|nr:hypothetical protein [Phormidium sp. CCY1219]MEB3827825.1 hypothetical protein [Phormidium sp. CCY1219]